MKILPRSALIVVDVQNDFCPGGSLAVPEGDRVIPVLNCYIETFIKAGAPIYFTRDWHPTDHCSFKPYGGIWPPHCVQNTEGAKFHPALHIPSTAVIISKAVVSGTEAYSAFDGTGLLQELKSRGIEHVYVGGLATDYCVKATVLDALKGGIKVTLIKQGCKGVEMHPGDTQRAIIEMEKAGASIQED